MTVEKLHDLKAAAVDVKMDIAFLKIRRDSFPYLVLRVHPLNFAPRGIADTLAVSARRNEKQLQIALIAVDAYNDSARNLSVTDNAVSLAVFYGVFYCCVRDNLAVLLKVIIPHAELLSRAVAERLLIVKDKLLFVIICKRGQLYAFVIHGNQSSDLIFYN